MWPTAGEGATRAALTCNETGDPAAASRLPVRSALLGPDASPRKSRRAVRSPHCGNVGGSRAATVAGHAPGDDDRRPA